MSKKPSYERIVMSLGDACHDAAAMGDHEIETQVRTILEIVIDRLYDVLDGTLPNESAPMRPRH